MYSSVSPVGLANWGFAVIPPPIVASDFSGLIVDALLIVGGIGLLCLAAGYATTLLLIGRKSKLTTISGTLVFAGAWFAAGWLFAEYFYW